jgi:hypothetical protein
MPNIFISYRRRENPSFAGRLRDALVARYGSDHVFMDFDSIPFGAEWRKVIADAVDRSDTLLALIGDRWLTIEDSQGQRRLDDPDDLVRFEITAALNRGRRVIPVLIEDAVPPDRSRLPLDLKPLADRNAVKLSTERWVGDIRRLLEALDRPPVPPPPTHPPDAPPMSPPIHPAPIAKISAAGIAMVALVVALLLATTRHGDTPASQGRASMSSSTTTNVASVTTGVASAHGSVVRGPWTGRSGGLTLTIDQITEGDVSTVALHAINATADSLTLPTSRFFLIDDTGKSYRVNMLSQWPAQLPAGTTVRGTIDVQEPIASAAKSLQAGFDVVYGSFAVESIKVSGIVLR